MMPAAKQKRLIVLFNIFDPFPPSKHLALFLINSMYQFHKGFIS